MEHNAAACFVVRSVGDIRSHLLSVPFIGFRHATFSTCVHGFISLSSPLTAVQDICQKYCLNTNPLISFAYLSSQIGYQWKDSVPDKVVEKALAGLDKHGSFVGQKGLDLGVDFFQSRWVLGVGFVAIWIG